MGARQPRFRPRPPEPGNPLPHLRIHEKNPEASPAGRTAESGNILLDPLQARDLVKKTVVPRPPAALPGQLRVGKASENSCAVGDGNHHNAFPGQISPVEDRLTRRPERDGARLAYSASRGARAASIIETNRSFEDQAPTLIPAYEGQFEAISWSPDGKWLAGHAVEAGQAVGIVIHSLETGPYQRLADIGHLPVWMNDSRRLLFPWLGKLWLVDRLDPRPRELYSLKRFYPPSGLALTISSDNRHVYTRSSKSTRTSG